MEGDHRTEDTPAVEPQPSRGQQVLGELACRWHKLDQSTRALVIAGGLGSIVLAWLIVLVAQ